ncbi:hypothetical protein JCM19231_1016 [Vibrio ishigakensis]|uniref:Uncharacterized protein n=1 Tax=Vibrio ishigakensis TaxID=1481914 RepID=A0A0B8P078_9VIBR|nr:hypothetical protein JCM19231_1016 [Vibrio ishigakensis]
MDLLSHVLWNAEYATAYHRAEYDSDKADLDLLCFYCSLDLFNR